MDITSHRGIPSFTESEVEAVRTFAMAMHGAQMYGDKPYVAHLDRVAKLAREYQLCSAYLVFAYCHDLLEDCAERVTREVLRARVGEWVEARVFNVSGFGDNRKARSEDILAKIAKDVDAALGKALDRLANILAAKEEGRVDLLKMYKKEQPLYAPYFVDAHAEIAERIEALLA